MRDRIKLGISGIPQSARIKGILDAIPELAEMGVEYLEIRLGKDPINTSKIFLDALRRRAQDSGLRLLVHAPPLLNLGTLDDEILRKTLERLSKSWEIADALEAEMLIIHAGYYPERVDNPVDFFSDRFLRISDLSFEHSSKLGLETASKKYQFGSFEEVLELCRRFGWLEPVLNLAHIHARTDGGLRRIEDVERILREARRVLGRNPRFLKYTDLVYRDGSEIIHKRIGEGDLPFQIVAEAIGRVGHGFVLICESPNPEEDLARIRSILDS